MARARAGLGTARQTHLAALEELQRLDVLLPELTAERDMHRERSATARAAAQAAQLALRDTLIRHESRRSTLESMHAAAARLLDQRTQLMQRHATLSAELADGDAPVLELQERLQAALDRRLEVEAEGAAAEMPLSTP